MEVLRMPDLRGAQDLRPGVASAARTSAECWAQKALERLVHPGARSSTSL
jgi:hypothetical protein